MSDWKRGPYGTNERADSVYWQYDNGTAKRSVLIPLSVEQAIIRSHPQVVVALERIDRRLEQYRNYVAEFTASADRGDSQKEPWAAFLRGKVTAYEYVIEGLLEIRGALAPWEGTGVVPVEGEAHG